MSLNIFEIIREKADERTKSLPSSLSRSVFSLSLSLSFRCGRCSENNQKGRERRLKATDETRALRLSLSLSLTPVLSLSSSLLLYHHHRRELDFGHLSCRRRKRWSRKARRIHRRHRRNPRRLRPGKHTPPRDNRTPEGARKRKTNRNEG